MTISDSYNTLVWTLRVEGADIPAVADVMSRHPRIKRCVADKGVYLRLRDVTKRIEHCNDEAVYYASVSVGDSEPDCFGVGYYVYSKDASLEEIAKDVCEDNYFGFTCEWMLNNYAPVMLKMPAPCSSALPDEYVSTDDENVDITYIREDMCHSIIGKLWAHVKESNSDGPAMEELAKELNLTADEFNAITKEF